MLLLIIASAVYCTVIAMIIFIQPLTTKPERFAHTERLIQWSITSLLRLAYYLKPLLAPLAHFGYKRLCQVICRVMWRKPSSRTNTSVDAQMATNTPRPSKIQKLYQRIFPRKPKEPLRARKIRCSPRSRVHPA